MKKHLALEYLLSTAWALDERLLSVMGQLAARDVDSLDLSELKTTAENLPQYQAVMAKDGKALGQCLELREGGVAVLHVNGVISRYATWFQAICGGASTQLVAKEFNEALNNPSVKAIVLNIDSPGGQADGIHELAEMIHAARGDKPIVAYVGGTGASAAYWVACAADELVIDATAMVGSIGVVATLTRYKDTDEGVERLEFVSSQSPKKRLDPASKEGRADWQGRLDQMADVFIDRVARNMGVTRETVLSDFGQGGVLIGQNAVDQGMAHRLGSLEGVISQLAERKHKMTDKKTKAVTLPAATEASTDVLIGAIKEQRPDVLEALQPKVEPEATALEHAGDIAAACASAGFPELAANLLKPDVTKASAERQIAAASGLKDVCAAAGIEGSTAALLAHLDDPVKLAGKAIHEAQAAGDDSSKIEGQVVGKEKQTAKIDGNAIMAKRKAKAGK
ncbi:S49 family peptidase [Vibrio parahaemolyticus]|nr:S49 family peptidase [Vibrio parahaemolyticus]